MIAKGLLTIVLTRFMTKIDYDRRNQMWFEFIEEHVRQDTFGEAAGRRWYNDITMDIVFGAFDGHRIRQTH